MSKLIYKETQEERPGIPNIVDKILFVSGQWTWDDYILKHGRWDFNCVIDGKYYSRIYSVGTGLYYYPEQSSALAKIKHADHIVCSSNVRCSSKLLEELMAEDTKHADYEIAKSWMESSKQSYLDDCEDKADARQYLVMDCNEQAGTNLSKDQLKQLAEEILP